jgi:hypothetical protein
MLADASPTHTSDQNHTMCHTRKPSPLIPCNVAARVAGSILDGTDIAAAVGARTEGLAGRETIRRCFFAMTRGQPKVPPRVPATVVGSVGQT